MNHSLSTLWNDERGFVVSIELVLLATIGVIGLIAGIASVRDGVTSELSDTAGSIQDLNQSYSLSGAQGHSGSTAGSGYHDATDFCDSANDPSGQADNCIRFDGAPANEGSASGSGQNSSGGNQGSGNQGSGNQGSGNQGSGNQGSGGNGSGGYNSGKPNKGNQSGKGDRGKSDKGNKGKSDSRRD